MYAPPPLPDQWSSTLLEKDYLALSLALHTRAVEAARTGHWVTDDDIVIVSSSDSDGDSSGNFTVFVV